MSLFSKLPDTPDAAKLKLRLACVVQVQSLGALTDDEFVRIRRAINDVTLAKLKRDAGEVFEVTANMEFLASFASLGAIDADASLFDDIIREVQNA